MKDNVIVEKIIKYCDMLDDTNKSFDTSFEKFKSSHIYQNAACMCILQIGELCKFLTDDYKKEHKAVDWKGWCGIRDVFAHQYGKLNLDSTWKTINVDFPLLRDEVKK